MYAGLCSYPYAHVLNSGRNRDQINWTGSIVVANECIVHEIAPSRLLGLFYEGPEERGKTTKEEWDHDEAEEGRFQANSDKIY